MFAENEVGTSKHPAELEKPIRVAVKEVEPVVDEAVVENKDTPAEQIKSTTVEEDLVDAVEQKPVEKEAPKDESVDKVKETPVEDKPMEIVEEDITADVKDQVEQAPKIEEKLQNVEKLGKLKISNVPDLQIPYCLYNIYLQLNDCAIYDACIICMC